MLDLLIAIFGMIITVFFIIGIHEFGHFIVARLLNIKVLRFSIGFGKRIYHWYDKKGTEYVIAAIPLGGYVKMLDETEEKVPVDERHLAYNNQPLYKKIAVIVAGPLFNLLFALILYWIVFMIGFTTMKPLIGQVTPNSIAYHAGLQSQDEIIAINNRPTLSWTAVVMQLLVYIGDNEKIPLKTQNFATGKIETHILDLTQWHMDELKPDLFKSLGIEPYQPEIPPIIGKLMPDSPAAHSPLKVNDEIIAIEGKAIHSWYPVLEIIYNNPDKKLNFSIKRNGKLLTLPVSIGYTRNKLLQKTGFLGISPHTSLPPTLFRNNQYGLVQAFVHAFQNMSNYTQLNFLLLGKMLLGKISFQSLGGPISIFDSAGTALTIGILPFLSFLAFLSIAIGVINILPIPGLDGGHLLFHFIEFVIRRPLSQNMQVFLYRIGFIILILLVIQGITNDVMRLA